MEALAAFGLATNVFTFVEFVAKLLKGVKEVYSTGSLPDLEHIRNDTVELQRFTKQLTDPASLAAVGAVKELHRLATECAALAGQMIDILDKVYTNSHKSFLRSKALVPWKAWRKQRYLDSIQSRINSHRSSILEQLAFIIHQDHISLSTVVQDSSKNHHDNAEQVRAQLSSMQRDLVTALGKSNTSTFQGHSDILDILHGIESKLEDLVRLDSVDKRVNKILDKLWFSDMLSREASVNDPAGESYSWILQTPEEIQDSPNPHGGITDEELAKQRAARKTAQGHFNVWLESGQGIFYISGKPGSGKSTLMKFLAQSSRTQQKLEAWAQASSRQLVLVKFFFWISGLERQSSIMGLYRAILWEALKQCPDLIPIVFPSRWENTDHGESDRISCLPLSIAEVQQAFERLQSAIVVKHALCIFIDGLDEYKGDHWKLGHNLASWRSEYVKICVSARPYNGFQQTLPLDASRHFQLHELNRGDIQDYVRGELSNDERFRRLEEQDQSSTEIIMHTLTQRAEGVFVWTVLAIKTLLEDITSQHSAHQLLSSLKKRIPNGLDTLFLQLLERIPRSDRKQAAASLLTMSDPLLLQVANGETCRSTCFNLVFHWYIEQIVQDLDHHSQHQDDTSRPNLQQSSQSQMDAAKARFNSRCAGFVSWAGESYVFQITHRTLGDFLRRSDIRAKLRVLASDVNLYTLLSRACVNIIRDFSGRQVELDAIWPQAWYIARVLFSIATRLECGSESIDEMLLSVFDLQRTIPHICIRTDLRPRYRSGYMISFGGYRITDVCDGSSSPEKSFTSGLTQLLCQEVMGANWNFIARKRQQLARLVPKASKPGILLATAVNAIDSRREEDIARAFDFAESLLKTGVSPNLNVSGQGICPSLESSPGKDQPYGYTVNDRYKEWADPTGKGTGGPTPSIWELFLQAASILLLCQPSAPCEVAFKMMELFLAHGANPEMWLIVSHTKASNQERFVEIPAKLHCVSLQQLVEVRKPPNSDMILRYFGKNKDRYMATSRRLWL